jgi:hypothetical protein
LKLASEGQIRVQKPRKVAFSSFGFNSSILNLGFIGSPGCLTCGLRSVRFVLWNDKNLNIPKSNEANFALQFQKTL